MSYEKAKELKENFTKNGLRYKLIKRNNNVALFGVKGTYTDKFTHFEVVRIYEVNDKSGHREVISNNGKFGKDGSKSFNKLEDAEEYFEVLKEKFNTPVR